MIETGNRQRKHFANNDSNENTISHASSVPQSHHLKGKFHFYHFRRFELIVCVLDDLFVKQHLCIVAIPGNGQPID